MRRIAAVRIAAVRIAAVWIAAVWIAAVCLVLSGFVAGASPPVAPPVHWHIKAAPAKPLRAGAKFDVTIAGEIGPGWHLYALEEPEGGPVATEVALTDGDPADLVRVEESRPRKVLDPLFGLETGFFIGSADFTLHLALDPKARAGKHPLHVLLRYQSCNDHVCLPPHTDAVEVPLAVSR